METKMEPRSALLDAEGVAEMLGISTSTLYRWRSLGEPTPPARKFGGILRWRVADVEAYIDEHAEAA